LGVPYLREAGGCIAVSAAEKNGPLSIKSTAQRRLVRKQAVGTGRGGELGGRGAGSFGTKTKVVGVVAGRQERVGKLPQPKNFYSY